MTMRGRLQPRSSTDEKDRIVNELVLAEFTGDGLMSARVLVG
jgi:hypothetical protein